MAEQLKQPGEDTSSIICIPSLPPEVVAPVNDKNGFSSFYQLHLRTNIVLAHLSYLPSTEKTVVPPNPVVPTRGRTADPIVIRRNPKLVTSDQQGSRPVKR